jgi:excinuclease ABC subunit A
VIVGLDHFDKVINVDQSPIGRTPRSNPATYTGLLTPIRELFAGVPGSPLARLRPRPLLVQRQGRTLRGLPGRRRDQGRDALPARHLRPCDVCHGKRYNRETLEVQYKGRNIHEILQMTVERRASSSTPCRSSRASCRRWSMSV